MRIRLRVRTLLIGVALLAIVLAIPIELSRRSARFNRLAAYHLQANEVLIDRDGLTLECVESEEGETLEEAVDKIYAAVGGRTYLAHKASTYHWKLFEKYRKAAESPWRSIAADPSPPRMADPPFHRDANYERRVREWDTPRTGGFQ